MNNELKPCPFCGEELSIEVLHGYHTSYGVKCDNKNCLINHINEAWDSQEEAMQAINRRPAPHKYTLEELREMDGQPVWCEIPNKTANSGWSVVGVTNGNVWLSHYVYTTHQTYGKTWVAYDRPPEEE